MVRITPIFIIPMLSISPSSFASTFVDISPNLRALATADIKTTTDSTKKSDVQATTNTGTVGTATGTGTGTTIGTGTGTGTSTSTTTGASDTKSQPDSTKKSDEATDSQPADNTKTTATTATKPADTTDTTDPNDSNEPPTDNHDEPPIDNQPPNTTGPDDSDAQPTDNQPADTTDTTKITSNGDDSTNTNQDKHPPVDSASGGIPPWIWNQKCHYYRNVDFEGWDIGSKRAPSVKYCCNICKFKPGCVTYSWSDYEGGTCWLKNGRPEYPIYKTGVQSAEIHASKPYLAAFETNTDYEGGYNDIGNVPGSWITACVQPCLSDTRCGAFSWSGFNGGTCWLKRYRGITKSSSVVSGVILKPRHWP